MVNDALQETAPIIKVNIKKEKENKINLTKVTQVPFHSKLDSLTTLHH
jgi:hypothetical protein